MSTSRVAHLVITNIEEIHYHKGKQNKWSKQIEFSAESNQFERKTKLGINEMHSNCEDSYRPVIIGFRAISPLISATSPEKMNSNTKLRTSSGTMNIHQQSSPLCHHKYRGDPLS